MVRSDQSAVPAGTGPCPPKRPCQTPRSGRKSAMPSIIWASGAGLHLRGPCRGISRSGYRAAPLGFSTVDGYRRGPGSPRPRPPGPIPAQPQPGPVPFAQGPGRCPKAPPRDPRLALASPPRTITCATRSLLRIRPALSAFNGRSRKKLSASKDFPRAADIRIKMCLLSPSSGSGYGLPVWLRAGNMGAHRVEGLRPSTTSHRVASTAARFFWAIRDFSRCPCGDPYWSFLAGKGTKAAQ